MSTRAPLAAGTGIEEELALISAGTDARRRGAGGRVEEIEPRVDWARMTALLRSTRLLPTLGPRALGLVENRAREPFPGELDAALRAGRRRDALLELTSARIVTMLAAEGIAAAVLKGPDLAGRLYGGAGRRLSSDMDLLVTPAALADAVEVVRGLGYLPPAEATAAGSRPPLHFTLLHESGMLPAVELHWRIHWYEERFAVERLLPPVAGDAEWRPEPEDELISLLLFYARDGFLSLRQAADLGAWWDRFGEQLSPGAFDRTMQAYRELEPALLAGLRAAQRTVGLPAARVSARCAALSRRGRIAVQLANPLSRSSAAQVYADMGLVDVLLAPSGEWRRFARRQLTADRDDPDSGASAWSRFAHGPRVLARCGLTLLRLLRQVLAGRRRTTKSILART